MRNPYNGRIPGWNTFNFVTSQPYLLANQPNAYDSRPRCLQSNRVLPEAMIYRVSSVYDVSAVYLVNITQNTSTDVTDSDYISIYTTSNPHGSGNIDVILLRQKPYNSMTNGDLYQYQVQDANSRVYYSEMWEATDLSCSEKLIRIDWSSSGCFYNNIDYANSSGWQHSVFLMARENRPEYVHEIEADTNNENERDIIAQTRYTYYRVQAKMTIDELAALSNLDGHSSTSYNVLNGSSPFTSASIEELNILNVDYTGNELWPIVTFNVKLNQGFDNDCCDEVDCPPKTPSAPTLALVGSPPPPSNVVRVTQGSVDDIDGWIEIQYSFDDSSWTDVGSPPYSYTDLANGIQVNIIGTGTDVYVRYVSKNWNCSYPSVSDSISLP